MNDNRLKEDSEILREFISMKCLKKEHLDIMEWISMKDVNISLKK